MSKKTLIATAVGSAFVASMAAAPIAAAAENPFALTGLSSGYQVADNHGAAKPAEGKCGAKAGAKMKDGKCGEGKCGNKAKMKDGKCGEGKCGATKKPAATPAPTPDAAQ
ncbi:MAG: hypothetical protein Q7I95_08025 [Thiobacillus sp.]|nr:hypothetical protein [Thiobacillus sp.]